MNNLFLSHDPFLFLNKLIYGQYIYFLTAPNPKAAVLVFESVRKDEDDDSVPSSNTSNSTSLDPLLSDSGILKVLIWLLAPVAAESSKHPQLLSSDPREAQGFIDRLRERSNKMGVTSNELESALNYGKGGGGNNSNGDDDLLKWAYGESDRILRAE